MAHLTNFPFECFYEIFTEDASQLLLYRGAKKSKMTKNPNQGGGGSCLNNFAIVPNGSFLKIPKMSYPQIIKVENCTCVSSYLFQYHTRNILIPTAVNAFIPCFLWRRCKRKRQSRGWWNKKMFFFFIPLPPIIRAIFWSLACFRGSRESCELNLCSTCICSAREGFKYHRLWPCDRLPDQDSSAAPLVVARHVHIRLVKVSF